MDIKKIQQRLEKFAKDRDWDQFHSPKNLTMALSVEVSELVEIFQWSNTGGLEEIKDPEIRKKNRRRSCRYFYLSFKNIRKTRFRYNKNN